MPKYKEQTFLEVLIEFYLALNLFAKKLNLKLTRREVNIAIKAIPGKKWTQLGKVKDLRYDPSPKLLKRIIKEVQKRRKSNG